MHKCNSKLKTNNMKKIFYFAFVALFSMAIASCGSKSSGSADSSSSSAAASGNSEFSDPGKVAEKGWEAYLRNGDFVKYLEPSASEEAKKAITETVKNLGGPLEEKSPQEFKAVSIDKQDGAATVKLCIITTMSDGTTLNDTTNLTLKEVDGNWYFRVSDFYYN